MSRQVRLTPDAVQDLERLSDFLFEKSPDAAMRAGEMIIDAVLSLNTFPERGRPHEPEGRELVVPFGRYAYIIQYRVDEDAVVVSRIFHSHENRL